MNVSIYIDEEMVEKAVANAIRPVINRLSRLEAKLDAFTQYEVEADLQEEMQMGIVTDKVTAALTEVEELRTVTDGIVAWNQTQTTTLTQLRADLAEAIANGATEADLAGLDEFISTTDAQTGRLAEVLTTGTDAEGETPEAPTPV